MSLEPFINKVICGDSREILKQIPDGSVDLILTDPPYGIELQAQRDSSKFKGITIANDNTLEWLPNLCFELFRIAKDKIFVFCSWQNIEHFKNAITNAKFIIKNVIVWDKEWFGIGNNFRPQYELIVFAYKKDGKTNTHDIGNIIRVQRLEAEKLEHINQKPDELIQILISATTKDGDIILDPFLGSGTTAEACINLDRNFIGIEIEEKYCEIARKRIEKARQSKSYKLTEYQ